MSGAMSQFPMAGGMGMSPGLGSAPGVPQGGMSGGPPGMGQQQMNPQMLQALMQAMQQRGGMQRPPMAGAPPGLPGAPQMPSPMPPQQNPNLAAFGQSAMGQGAGGRPRLTPAEMARLGQHGDSIVAHLTPGEMQVPPQVQTPKVLATLRQAYHQAGVSPAQFTAGSPQQSVNPQTSAPQFNWLDSWLPAIIGAAGVAAAPFSGGASLAGTAAAEGAAAAPAVAGGATAALGSELAAAAPAVAGTAAGGAAAAAPALAGAAPSLAATGAEGAGAAATTGAAATGATGAATEGATSGAAPAAAQAATHAATDASILPPQVTQNMAPFRAAAANQTAPISGATPVAAPAIPPNATPAVADVGSGGGVSTGSGGGAAQGSGGGVQIGGGGGGGGTPWSNFSASVKNAAPYLGTAAKIGTAVAPLAASLFPGGGAKNPATAGYGQVANKPLANPPGAYLGGNPSAVRPMTPSFQGYNPFQSVYGQPYNFYQPVQQ